MSESWKNLKKVIRNMKKHSKPPKKMDLTPEVIRNDLEGIRKTIELFIMRDINKEPYFEMISLCNSIELKISGSGISEKEIKEEILKFHKFFGEFLKKTFTKKKLKDLKKDSKSFNGKMRELRNNNSPET